MRRVLIAQFAITLAVALGFLMFFGTREAQSALYGGGALVLNSALLARRIRRAEAVGQRSAAVGAATLYLGAVQRFVLVLALLMVGLGLLKLLPVPLVAGFAAAHLGYLMGLAGPVETSRSP
jgi:ATP synthase protein I